MIGLNDRRQESVFEFTDGTPLTFSDRWAKGQPDNRDYTESCVAFSFPLDYFNKLVLRST